MTEEAVEVLISELNEISSTKYPFGIDSECEYAAYRQSQFDPADDIVFCHQFEANDYYQIFIIAMTVFSMYLGMYLLSYRRYIVYTTTIINAKMSTLTSSKGYEQLINKIEEEQKRELTFDKYAGMPFKLYLFLNSLLSLIYLLIKVILITNAYDFDADNRYKDINDRFHNDGFKTFINAETIILTFLIIHNTPNAKSVTKLYNFQKASSFNGCSRCIMLLCLVIIWIDFITSIVIICYKWSLLIFSLYCIGVALFYAVCLIISCCFTLPIFICFVIVSMKLFTICGRNNCFGRFIMSIGAAIIVAILYYLSLCAILCFLFLFVDGPSHSIIYINGDDPNHMAVVMLFCGSIFIGFLSMIIGIFFNCKNTSYDSGTQQLTFITDTV